MAEVKCQDCGGKGHTTTLIAGDVHIAECPECLGWGTVTEVKTKPVFHGGRFGRIDDIDLVRTDKKSSYPATVNIDSLLSE